MMMSVTSYFCWCPYELWDSTTCFSRHRVRQLELMSLHLRTVTCQDINQLSLTGKGASTDCMIRNQSAGFLVGCVIHMQL